MASSPMSPNLAGGMCVDAIDRLEGDGRSARGMVSLRTASMERGAPRALERRSR